MEINLESQGCLLALSRDQAKQLFGTREPARLLELMSELRTELANSEFSCDCSGDWPPLQRCLSDGSLDPHGGEPPANLTFLGGRHLDTPDHTTVVVVRPDMVRHVATFLRDLEDHWLAERLEALNLSAENDSSKLADLLRQVGSLYEVAAANQCCVVFFTATD